jgi:hypothetical protein
MNYEAGKIKRPITDQVRATVVEDLPEINDIVDSTLSVASRMIAR